MSQLLVDAPPGLSDSRDQKLTTVEEMDDIIVSCVSQMALTSGSDLFWKPLNREVCTSTQFFKTVLLCFVFRLSRLLPNCLPTKAVLPRTIFLSAAASFLH